MQRILISGGAGYLGSVLVPKLLAEGHHVTVLDTFMFGDNSLGAFCRDPNFDVHRVDCRDVNAVRPFLAKADVLIPLAALVGHPLCQLNPLDAVQLNEVSMKAIIRLLSPEQLMIWPSTESVYGRQSEICTEETTPAPLVPYGVQKLAVEKALEDRANSISFRMATLFGMSPRMRIDLLINDFTWRAVKDHSLVVFEGSATRTCLHVQDAARAFVHCLNMRPKAHEIYNIGSVFVSKLSLCEKIAKEVPGFHYTEAQFTVDPDARNYTVKDDKIRATGFAPRETLEGGIRELIKGYRMLSNSRHSNVG